VLFLLLNLCLPLSATAQTQLNLEKAVNLALDFNLNLQKTKIDLEASGYSERNLWSEIFPTISANLNASYGTPFPLFTRTEETPPFSASNIRYGAGFGVNLGLNAGIPYAMRSIRLAHQGNLLRYEDACNQLSIQVTKNFYSLITEKNNLLLLEDVLNFAQRQYDRNRTLFNNGLIRELVVLQSSLALENARFSLNTANIAYTNRITEFLALLGLAHNTDIELSGEVNIVRISANADFLINEYLDKRPDIERSKHEIERLVNAQKHLAMQNRSPSLGLGLNWSSNNFNPFEDNVSASATLRIPIDPWITGTSGSQSVRRAYDSIEKAVLDLEIAQNSAKTQIRTLTALLHNTWDSIEIARLGYEAARRNYQMTEQAFNNGTVEYLILDDARSNMASAMQRILQSEHSYLNMILDLSSALNIDWKYFIQTFGVPDD
jgi:outer membrane protein TolC